MKNQGCLLMAEGGRGLDINRKSLLRNPKNFLLTVPKHIYIYIYIYIYDVFEQDGRHQILLVLVPNNIGKVFLIL